MPTVNFNLDSYHIWEYFPDAGVGDWATFRNYSGTDKIIVESEGYFTRVESNSGYRAMTRSFVGFLIAGITSGSVASAKIHIYQYAKNYTWFNGTPSIAVGFYNRNADIPNTDYYNCMGTTCTIYPRGNNAEWQDYTLAPSLIQNGYMQFVFRDGAFDYPNITPDWDSAPFQQCYDNVAIDLVSNRPYLEVTYLAAPTVTTQAVTGISLYSATGNGTITDNGDSSIIQHGHCWNTTGTPTISDSHTSLGPSAVGAFTSNMTALTPGVLYYVRAYASNYMGVSYGAQVTFTTLVTPPTVITDAATVVTDITSVLNGHVTAINDTMIKKRGFVWDTVSRADPGNVSPHNTSYSNDWAEYGSYGLSTFSHEISGLTLGTTYYFRAAAANEYAWAYGSELSLTTSSVIPSVTTNAATSIINTLLATLHGEVTAFHDSSITARGFVWGVRHQAAPGNVDPNTTLYDSNWTETGSFGLATFARTISLTGANLLYFRACAQNDLGNWGYGEEITLALELTLEMAFGQSIFTASPTWTDVSVDLMALNTKRGRMHELNRIEAGTAVFTLNNASGNWWRNNTTGDYTPDVMPLTLVRLTGGYNSVAYPLYYGVIESIKPGWLSQAGYGPIVEISCVDLFKSFNRLTLQSLSSTVASTPAKTEVAAMTGNANSGQKNVVVDTVDNLYAGQSLTIGDDAASEVNVIASINMGTLTVTMTTNLANNYTTAAHGYIKKFPAVLSDVRVRDTLLEMGWPASLTSLDTSKVTVCPLVPPTGGTNAMKHLYDVADAEDGLIFQRGDGKVVFQNRDARQSSPFNTSQGTFTDDGTDYIQPDLFDDDTFIFNLARISRAASTENGNSALAEQLFYDETAMGTDGERAIIKTDSLVSSVNDALDQAIYAASRYKASKLRCQSLLIYPDVDPATLYPLVLGGTSFATDISGRVTLNVNSPMNPGAIINQQYHIEGIEHTWDAKSNLWRTSWQLWDVNLYKIYRYGLQTSHGSWVRNGTLSPTTYTTCHNAANGVEVVDDGTQIKVGQQDITGDYGIWRVGISFDTTTLSVTPVSADIILSVATNAVIDNTFNLTLTGAGGTTPGAFVNGDYNTLMGQTTSYGSVTIATPGILKDTVLIIHLNAAGLAAINVGGVTKFGLRSSRDISSTDPGGTAYEWVILNGVASSSVPRLLVRTA